MNRKILSVFLLVVLYSGAVAAPSLQVAPTEADLGEVEPGTTQEFTVYVHPFGTNSEARVTPVAQGPFTTTLYNNSEVNPSQVSEESITGWINFPEGSTVADPSDARNFNTEGGSVKASATVPVEVEVPEDAEPGYHAAKIGFDVSPTSESSIGTTNWVLPSIELFFRVQGPVEKQLRVSDVRGIRTGQNQAQIITMLENRGTVTTTVEGGTVDILNDQNEKVGEIELGFAEIPPNDFREVSMTWSEGVEPGTYQLNGQGSYRPTGSFFLGGEIAIQQAIQDRVEIQDPEGTDSQEDGGVPMWLVVMILVLLGALMYSFEIDPLWIVLIIGVLSITASVLISDLPVYIIGITLIVGFLMIYYGVV